MVGGGLNLEGAFYTLALDGASLERAVDLLRWVAKRIGYGIASWGRYHYSMF